MKPCGTVQLYWPAAFEIPQLPPVAPAKLTPLSGEPLAVTVPLSVKVVGTETVAA